MLVVQSKASNALSFLLVRRKQSRAELVQLNALNIIAKRNVDGYFNVEKNQTRFRLFNSVFFYLFLYFFFIPIMLTYSYQFQL